MPKKMLDGSLKYNEVIKLIAQEWKEGNPHYKNGNLIFKGKLKITVEFLKNSYSDKNTIDITSRVIVLSENNEELVYLPSIEDIVRYYKKQDSYLKNLKQKFRRKNLQNWLTIDKNARWQESMLKSDAKIVYKYYISKFDQPNSLLDYMLHELPKVIDKQNNLDRDYKTWLYANLVAGGYKVARIVGNEEITQETRTIIYQTTNIKLKTAFAGFINKGYLPVDG